MTNRVFSIVTPVHDPPRRAFADCIESVMAQDYPHWQWCLVDDSSSDPWVGDTLETLARDPRVTVRRRERNGGIAAASNDALVMATGEFVVLLDHDDVLAQSALGAINHEIWRDETTDYLYSDEDKIAPDGTVFGEFRKPAWSPERLLCQNYCCHVSAFRRSLVDQVGGFRSEFDGAQDHDLILRVTERARRIVHIPKVLYHWSVVEGSTAGDADAKPYAVDAGRRAIAAALSRRGIDGDIVDAGHGYHRVRRRLSTTPKVSIIVPTRGTIGRVWGLDIAFVVNMISSVRHHSTYPDLEIVVVHDVATDRSILTAVERLAGEVVFVEYDEPFNFSKMCNAGALASSGEILLFLNDDTEVKTRDWVEAMIGFLEDRSVGMVGPLLLYDNHLVQSAGHLSAPPSHFARGRPPSVAGGPGRALALNREVMGVTGACVAIRRETFVSVGGFSIDFPLNYNDVDLCFKVIETGRRIIWTPGAEMFHFESKSRRTTVDDSEIELLLRLWGRHIRVDPLGRTEVADGIWNGAD